MKKLLFVLCLLAPKIIFGQTDLAITEADKKEIRYLAANKINELKDLLNTISFEDATESQRKEVILNSYLPGPSKVFYNDAIRIDDDINPENALSAREVLIEDYLKNFDLFYKKTPEPSIEFNNVVVSDVLKGDYIYARIVYKSTFKSTHKTQNQKYEPANRIADVRAEKIDKKWVVYITRVAYFNPVTDKFTLFQEQATSPATEQSTLAPERNPTVSSAPLSPAKQAEINALKREIATYKRKKKGNMFGFILGGILPLGAGLGLIAYSEGELSYYTDDPSAADPNSYSIYDYDPDKVALRKTLTTVSIASMSVGAVTLIACIIGTKRNSNKVRDLNIKLRNQQRSTVSISPLFDPRRNVAGVGLSMKF